MLIPLLALASAQLVVLGAMQPAAQPTPPNLAPPPAADAAPGTTGTAQPFVVADAALHQPLVFVIYGDTRFTDPRETVASNPGARRALVARVAEEHPDALILSGDLPWHGNDLDDYRVYAEESKPWTDAHLRIYPVLGNHEFAGCPEAQCLQNWWQVFPELTGRRWYELALGSTLRVFALDSDTSLLPGSEQRGWLEQRLGQLPAEVRFVILALHHPPVADDAWFIVRPNERSLLKLLGPLAKRSAARFLVCAGHVHNYERFERGGVTYLVSGGGGAKPLAVVRSPADRYRHREFPNYHYLRFELQGATLSAQMVRLADYDAPAPHEWAVMDRFSVTAKTP
jgi:acid phosphatase type 7